MLRNKYIEEEIWRLKNKDKPRIKDKAVPPNLMDGPIDQRNLKDEKIIRFASGVELDELAEATQFMKELFEQEIKAGNIPSSMSYGDWITSLRTSLSGGGKVVDFTKYAKSKKPKIKTIDVGAYLDLGRRLSDLSKSERETLSWILNRSFKGKD